MLCGLPGSTHTHTHASPHTDELPLWFEPRAPNSTRGISQQSISLFLTVNTALFSTVCIIQSPAKSEWQLSEDQRGAKYIWILFLLCVCVHTDLLLRVSLFFYLWARTSKLPLYFFWSLLYKSPSNTVCMSVFCLLVSNQITDIYSYLTTNILL